MLAEFGDGVTALCAFGCGRVVDFETVTIDRYPVLGCDGGTYRRGNIRPACAWCNCAEYGSRARSGAGTPAGA